MPFRPTTAAAIVLVVALVAVPVLASDPPAQDGEVPAEPGGEVVLTWTGQALPGAEQSGECTAETSDVHEITLAVPDGAYDDVRVAARVDVTYEGPVVDLIVTVRRPDGSTVTGDSGFTDTDETVSYGNPEPGVHTVYVCAFAGAAPQPYEGAMTLSAEAITPTTSSGPTCLEPADTLKFTSDIIDTTRAGGEPIVETLEDGTLLWGSHAGTTHFYGPAAPDETTAAFIENYQGQTYQYFSEDDGATWQFVPRTPIEGANAPGQGFSDPVFTVDQAGNVFISEINLANVAVSKSTDGGRSYDVTNVLSFVNSDRQWMAADEEDVLYMTANAVGSGGAFPLPPTFSGHFIAKSLDGGATWVAAEQPNPDGVADIQVDFTDGTLYEIQASSDGTIGMGAFRDIRDQTSGFAEGFEIAPIAEGVGMSPINRLIDPTFDSDDEGNLYTVWTDNGTGAADREPGIYYSYSTDRGATWHQPPIRVDTDARTDIWPWIAVGAPGQVAISYLQVDEELEDNNAELASEDAGWHVITAHTQNGQGCGDSDIPGFRHTRSTDEPVHFGTICQGGTLCQAQAIDRRLGDYFANEIDGDGNVYISVSDTSNGGAVALPRVVRQVEGDSFLQPPSAVGCTPAGDAEDPGASQVVRVDEASAVALSVALGRLCVQQADAAILARDDVFADALAGSGLAGALSAPVLLTPTGGLDSSVAGELTRLGVETVYLLGGTAALSAQVAEDAAALGVEVVRLSGPERFATAARISEEVVALHGPRALALVALGARPGDGDAWPDALASSAVSTSVAAPVVLTRHDRVPEETLAALRAAVGEGGRVLVAGGTAAISDAVLEELTAAGFTVERRAGSDRYGTGVALVREALELGASPQVVVLASGEAFAGPLVAGPAAVLAGGVMVLVQGQSLDNGQGVAELLAEHAEQIQRVVIAGDAGTISPEVQEQVEAILAGG